MSEPITTQQSAYDFILESFIIRSHRHNKPIDVTTSISIFEIFENIEKPYLTGNVIMRDDMRFYDGVKINGTELCEITLSQPALDAVPVTLRFVIQYVKGTQKVGDQVEMIDFRIIEQTAFNSSIHQFSKSYQGTPEQIIQNICTDHLSVDVDMPKIKCSQSPMKVIIPYMNPYQACAWILERMSTSDGVPYFLFKTIKDENLQLKSFDEMSRGKTWNKLPYTYATSNLTSTSGSISSEQIFNVEACTQHASEGIYDLISNGAMGSKHTITDLGSGQSETFQHNLSDTYKSLESIGILEKGIEPSVTTGVYETSDGLALEQMNNRNFHRLISNNTYNDWKNIYEEFDRASLKVDNTRRVIKKLLNKSSINITVPGLPYLMDEKNRSLGNNIDFIYIANNTSIDTDADMIDKKRSGKYLVYAARHVFDENQQHKTHLMGVKLGMLV